MNRGNGISEIEGKVARVATSALGGERVSIEEIQFMLISPAIARDESLP
jgi:hypothetical protein